MVTLRNALVHYRPEWDDHLDVHQVVRDAVEGRFALNPLAGSKSLWFPHQCLGAGCAMWATDQVASLVKEVTNRLGIPSRLP